MLSGRGAEDSGDHEGQTQYEALNLHGFWGATVPTNDAPYPNPSPDGQVIGLFDPGISKSSTESVLLWATGPLTDQN